MVGHQTRLPHLLEDAGLDPLLETIVGRGARAEAGGVQSLPLAAGAKHKEDGFHTNAIRRTRPAAAEAMRVLVLGKQPGDGLPEIVGDVPLIHDGQIHNKGAFHD
jgi:hypothetical protein